MREKLESWVTSRLVLIVSIVGLIVSILAFITTACTEDMTRPTKEYIPVSVPAATGDFYVNDFADVFSPTQEKELIERAKNLANTSNGVQVVITTVKSLEGSSIADYAYSMYNTYGIGKNDMGILILLSTGDRLIRVQVGKQMEAYITDAQAGRFTDKHAIPLLKENKFDEGLISLQKELIKEIESTVPALKEEEPTEVPASPTPELTQEPAVSAEETPLPELSEIPDLTKYSSDDNSTTWIVIAIIAAIGTLIGLVIALIKKSFKMAELGAKLGIKEQEAKTLQRDNSYLQSEKEQLERENSGLQRRAEEAEDSSSRLKRANENLTAEKEELSRAASRWKGDYEHSQGMLTAAKRETAERDDLLGRIRKLHPTIDDEVQKMIKQEEHEANLKVARQFDSLVKEAIALQVGIAAIMQLQSVVTAYDRLTKAQKELITTEGDFGQIKVRLAMSREMEKDQLAKDAKEKIEGLISGITTGEEKNITVLERALSIFENLAYDVKQRLDEALISRVRVLLKDARAKKEKREAEERRRREEERRRREEERRRREEERRRREEEEKERRRREEEEKERRRRQREEEERQRQQSYFNQSSNSWNSFGGSSGGFGGSTGGGGATRGF